MAGGVGGQEDWEGRRAQIVQSTRKTTSLIGPIVAYLATLDQPNAFGSI